VGEQVPKWEDGLPGPSVVRICQPFIHLDSTSENFFFSRKRLHLTAGTANMVAVHLSDGRFTFLPRTFRCMDTTPASLFDRLRQPGDDSAWLRFAEICTPLLHRWARHLGLQASDTNDLEGITKTRNRKTRKRRFVLSIFVLS
jgi:hypothetical protein